MAAAILPIVLPMIPEVENVIKSIIALRKKYPQMTPDQINQLVAATTAQADTAFDDVLSKIAADQGVKP